ncbi:hypothetical protein HPB47_013948, partial [Ixodes persulcatus]
TRDGLLDTLRRKHIAVPCILDENLGIDELSPSDDSGVKKKKRSKQKLSEAEDPVESEKSLVEKLQQKKKYKGKIATLRAQLQKEHDMNHILQQRLLQRW